jgi:phosphatidylglycerophosphate synthase
MPIDKEAIGFLIVGGLIVAAILFVIRLLHERNACPSCGNNSGPMFSRRQWDELVKCKSCGYKWRRVPISGYESELPHKASQQNLGNRGPKKADNRLPKKAVNRLPKNDEGTENWFPKYLFWIVLGIAFFVLLDYFDPNLARMPPGFRIP